MVEYYVNRKKMKRIFDMYGTVVTGLVTDENNDSYFVQKNGVTYTLVKSELQADELYKIGDTVTGFIYENTQRKKRITTTIPKVKMGSFAFGTVTEVRKDLGVFVHIGLTDKEIVVSLDDLPELKHLWPKKNDKLMISLKVDKKDRLWGVLADEKVFKSIAKLGKESDKNKNIVGVAYRLKVVGTYILTEDYQIGFIHPSERIDEPRLGEKVSGRVIGVRPDGVLNISLRQRAHEAIGDDAAMILALLKQEPSHTLPFHDKSDPDAIKVYFGISKGQFKRAVGNLLKQRLIIQENEMIKLVKK